MPKKAIINSQSPKETPAQIVFKGDFQQELSGEIKPGSEVAILFDSTRLPLERSLDAKGKPAWTISAFYHFLPAGDINKIDLVPEKGTSRKKGKALDEPVLLKGVFTVPAGSEETTIWFLNTGSTGDEHYDSAFGNNYRFGVLPGEAEVENTAPAPVKKRRAKTS